MGRPDRSWSSYWNSIRFSSAMWARTYLLIAAPTLFVLCFVTQVFHSLDEPAHFLRVTQLAGGDLLPILGPDGKSTGSFQSRGVVAFARFYGARHVTFMNAESRSSLEEVHKLYEIKDEGPLEFVEHSNTTIYFPVAYAAAVPAVALAKFVSSRPLVWFYAARLANAAVALIVTALCISAAGSLAPAVFTLSLIPIVLFQAAAVSADALLIPAAFTMALLTLRIMERRHIDGLQYVGLVLSLALVGLGKFAYIPIILIPVLALYLSDRSISRQFILLAVATCAIVAIWLLWSLTIKPLTFTMRQDEIADRVDVNAQLHYVIAAPLKFLGAILLTIKDNVFKYIESFLGGRLGWMELRLPLPLTIFTFFVLIGNYLFQPEKRAISWPVFSSVLLLCLSSITLTFLLLYLQWNDLHAERVSGVQGRYFLPLVPFILIALPKIGVSRNIYHSLQILTLCWGFVVAVATIFYVTHRYWVLFPASA